MVSVWANANFVCYARRGQLVVTCDGSLQTSQRGRFMDGTDDVRLDAAFSLGPCALDGFMLKIGGDFNRRRELRLGELVVLVLRLFAPWRLFQGLRVNGFSGLACC